MTVPPTNQWVGSGPTLRLDPVRSEIQTPRPLGPHQHFVQKLPRVYQPPGFNITVHAFTHCQPAADRFTQVVIYSSPIAVLEGGIAVRGKRSSGTEGLGHWQVVDPGPQSLRFHGVRLRFLLKSCHSPPAPCRGIRGAPSRHLLNGGGQVGRDTCGLEQPEFRPRALSGTVSSPGSLRFLAKEWPGAPLTALLRAGAPFPRPPAS